MESIVVLAAGLVALLDVAVALYTVWFVVRWVLRFPRVKALLVRSENPARDGLVALLLLMLIAVPAVELQIGIAAIPSFGDLPGKNIDSATRVLSFLLGIVGIVSVVVSTFLFVGWGCHVIRRTITDKRYVVRIGWSVLVLVSSGLFSPCFGSWMDSWLSNLLADGLLRSVLLFVFVKCCVWPYAWVAMVVLLPCIWARRMRAWVWATALLCSLGMFLLAFAAAMPQWYWVGKLVFVLSAIECIRALPFGERVTIRWHFVTAGVLALSVIGGVTEGCLRHIVETSPFRHSVDVNGECLARDDSLWNVYTSRHRKWLFFTNLGTLEKTTELSEDYWDFIGALNSVDVDSGNLRETLENNMTNACAVVSEQLLGGNWFIDAAIDRDRQNASKISWAAFVCGMTAFDVAGAGGGSCCPTVLFISHGCMVGKLGFSDAIRMIERYAKPDSHVGYSPVLEWRERATIQGLRRAFIRDVGNVDDALIREVRTFVQAKGSELDGLRLQALATSYWSVLADYEKTGESVLWCVGVGAISSFQSYLAYRMFETRMRTVIEEKETAKKVSRNSNYGRAILWPEYVVTTLADAYGALDLSLAVEQYRRAKGVLPNSLEALVPEFIVKVPVCITDGSSFDYETGDLSVNDHERLPESLDRYRLKDAKGNAVKTFKGYRISFKYAKPTEEGPKRFTVPVICK